MSSKILAVDDEPDFELLLPQRFRRQVREHQVTFRFAQNRVGSRAAAERARNNLSRYFSPNLVEMLAERDEPLGAVRRQTVAVLFADIVGFTRMAERLAPEAVLAMLREYHERMTAQIFACGGTVEKYIGDAILAVFGLPHATAQDAANALRCADRMLAALAGWNRVRERHEEPALAIGIGLNYGPAVIGDV